MALNKERDIISKDTRISNLPADFRPKLPGVTLKLWNIWERFFILSVMPSQQFELLGYKPQIQGTFSNVWDMNVSQKIITGYP